MPGLPEWSSTSPRRGRRIVVVLLLVVVSGIGIGLGAATLTAATLSKGLPAVRALAARVPTPMPAVVHPALRPVGADGPAPTRAGVGALLTPLTTAGGLGTLSGQVLDPATGTVLWQRNPDTALVPGSTAKVLTACAVLLALNHQQRWHTTVLAGAEPGTVVLRGGGDPTLSAASPGTASGYPGAARLDELVGQVLSSSPVPVRRVLVDVSRYTGDALAPGWVPADVAGGYIAPIEPVMLDAGREDPTQEDSPRTATPATAAAVELARRLGADPDTVAIGSAPPGAAVLGEVSSPPMEDLVATALERSDNVLAEALARQVARATGTPASFSGASQAVRTVLRTHGFDVSGVTLVDGSGLSVNDSVPARVLTVLLSAAAAPDMSNPAMSNPAMSNPAMSNPEESNPDMSNAGKVRQQRTAALRPLLTGLPVAGGSGTLAERYSGPAAAGRGWVRAKTGTLTGVTSLAGTVLDADGRVLVFALLSNGPNPASVRPRLDTLAARLRSCGCY